MNKTKKIVALVFAFMLCITATFGATLAYLTDTDDETNTFTVGNVEIELIEEQRKVDDEGNKTTELEEFVNEKVLLPIVGSAQAGKDGVGMPTAANYVDKMVTVENTGDSDAYIRVFVAIPHNLDDGADTFNAAANVLHFNFGSKEVDGQWVSTYKKDWSWGTTSEGTDWKSYETTIAVDLPSDDTEEKVDVLYTVYVGTYLTPVVKDGVTTRAIDGFYLDAAVDCTVVSEGDVKQFVWTKNDQAVGYELEKGVVIPVFAQAVQADGFADAFTAFEAAKLTDPWTTIE